jgi:hypothetical protein
MTKRGITMSSIYNVCECGFYSSSVVKTDENGETVTVNGKCVMLYTEYTLTADGTVDPLLLGADGEASVEVSVDSEGREVVTPVRGSRKEHEGRTEQWLLQEVEKWWAACMEPWD